MKIELVFFISKDNMKLTNNTLLCVATILVAICLVVMHYQNKTIQDFKNLIEQADTTVTIKRDTIWKDTTITEKEFVPKYITKIKTDTLIKTNGDTVQLATESKRFDKRLTIDKDTADLQIYTTGIETSLDSLKMALKKHNEVITNTVEITKYIEKPKTFWKRFHIQPQVTSGYDIINKQWGITAGIGVGFDI